MRKVIRQSISCLLLLAVLLTSSYNAPSVRAAEADPPMTTIHVPTVADKTPVIDGVIEDTEWNEAAQSAGFVTFTQSEAVPEPTFFKVFFTEDKLYIAVHSVQKEKPSARVTEHDGPVYTEDSVEIFFQPDVAQQTYYQFVINAMGTKYEGQGRNSAWGNNEDWSASANTGNGYWDLEVELPASLFGISSFSAEEYGFNISRSQSAGDQGGTGPMAIPAMIQSSWSPYYNGSFHDTAAFGRLYRNAQDNNFVRQTVHTSDLKNGFQTVSGFTNTTSGDVTIKAVQEVRNSSTGALLGGAQEETVAVAAGASHDFILSNPLQQGKWDNVLTLTDANSGKVYYSRKIPVDIPPPLKVRAYWSEQKAELSLDKNDVNTGFNAQTSLFELQDGQGTVISDQEVNADSAGVFKASFDMSAHPAGNYQFVATLKGNRDSFALPPVTLEKPATPEWWDSDLGTEDVVLAPWTGVKTVGNKVEIWGREYAFGDSPFVSQITSQGQELLAAPIQIEGNADARELHFYETNDIGVEKTDTAVQYLNESVSDDLKLSVNSTVEYDGFIRFDVKLSSDSDAPVQLQNLKVNIPMKPEAAKLFDADTTDSPLRGSYPYWSGARSGKFPDAAAGSFTPHIFIGNDQVGLTWVAESTQNWSFQDAKKVLALKKQSGAHVLEMNVIDKAIEVNRDTPLTFTFAIQASPIRPQAENKQVYIYGSSAYGAEQWEMNTFSQNKGQLSYPAKDYVTPEYGELTVNAAPWNSVTANWSGGYPDDPQNEMATPVVAIKFPNGNSFGLYYSMTSPKFFLTTETGFNTNRVRHEIKEFEYTNQWPIWWERYVKLKWNESTLEVWITDDTGNFAKQAEIPFDFDLMNASLQEAKIVFGSGFVYNDFSAVDKNGASIAWVQAEDASQPGRALTGNYELLPDASNPARVYVGGPDFNSNRDWPLFLNRLKSDHYQLLKIHEDWTESQGYPMTREQGRKDALHALATAANEKGIPVIPYIGFQLGNNTPEFQYYKDEIVTEPFFLPNGWVRSDTNHIGANISYAGQYQNFMLWSIKKLIEEDHIGGLYMDSTALPPVDQNLHHGAGYYDRDGNLQSSYQIFEYRKFMKRLRTMGKAIRPDFYMDLHTPVGTWTPTAGFTDSIWKGEQFLNAEANPSEKTFRREVTPELLRATMGTQTGLNINFLNYAQVDSASAVTAVLNIPVRMDGLLRAKMMEYYDLNNAQFILYSDSQIAGSNEETPMSYYKRSDGAVVAVTANLSQTDEPRDVTFTLPDGLILPGSMATDAINGDNMILNGNTLTVHFEQSWRYKYILLAPESVVNPVRYPFEWPSIGFPN